MRRLNVRGPLAACLPLILLCSTVPSVAADERESRLTVTTSNDDVNINVTGDGVPVEPEPGEPDVAYNWVDDAIDWAGNKIKAVGSVVGGMLGGGGSGGGSGGNNNDSDSENTGDCSQNINLTCNGPNSCPDNLTINSPGVDCSGSGQPQ